MVTGASGASQVPPKIQRKKQRVGSPRPGIKTSSAAAQQSAEAEQPAAASAAARQPEQSAGESSFKKRLNLPVAKRFGEFSFAAAETKAQTYEAAQQSAEAEQPAAASAAAHQPEQSAGESSFQKWLNLPVAKRFGEFFFCSCRN